ncbi:MAG: hypothetical protein Q7S57_00870 [bacterium]|nr:hypothetical protein [bacterium]
MDNDKETPNNEDENQESDDEIMNPIFKWDFYGFVCMIISAWVLLIPVSGWLGGSDFVFWALVLFNLYLSLWLWRYAGKYLARKSYETGIPLYLPITDEEKKKREEKKRRQEEAQRRDERILKLLLYGAIIFAVALVVIEFLNEGVTGFIDIFR